MEQYKVILVDDEVEVIDVMKKKIRWNDLGFDVVGSATNGVKAKFAPKKGTNVWKSFSLMWC